MAVMSQEAHTVPVKFARKGRLYIGMCSACSFWVSAPTRAEAERHAADHERKHQ